LSVDGAGGSGFLRRRRGWGGVGEGGAGGNLGWVVGGGGGGGGSKGALLETAQLFFWLLYQLFPSIRMEPPYQTLVSRRVWLMIRSDVGDQTLIPVSGGVPIRRDLVG